MDKHPAIAEPSAQIEVVHMPPLSVVGKLRFLWRRDILDSLEKMSRKGDVVNYQVGSWDYWLFMHPDAIRDLLLTLDGQTMKGPALRRTQRTLGNGLLTSEGDFHKRQRRLIQPDLHPQRVATYADCMTRFAADTASGWRDGQEIDLHAEMMKLTLRIVAKTLFDADMGDEVHAIGHAMDISVGMFSRAMTPWGPMLDRLPLPSNFRFRRAWRQLSDTIDRFIRDHRAKGASTDDLLSRLLHATDTEGDGSGMTDRQLRDEAITLFTAGHETTANALAFTLYLVSRHPDVRRQLDAELGTVLANHPARFEDVENLPYTRAVLSEGMRLYPPAWAVARETTEPCTINGVDVPRGAIVLLSQWVTHRDPRWWPDPTKFDPSRFDPSSRATRPRWAYFPFGGGSRQCVGESFAWMEAILVLATLLREWEMDYLDAAPPTLKALITLRPGGPIRMRLRKRHL